MTIQIVAFFALAYLSADMVIAEQSTDRRDEKSQIGDWTVESDKKYGSCFAFADYGGGQKLVLGYHKRNKMVSLGYSDAHAGRFAVGTKRRITLYLFGGGADGTIGYYPDRLFTALERNDGARLIMSDNLRPGFFLDLYDKESVSFWYENQPIASFEIKNVGRIIPKLARCADKAGNLTTVDPF